MSDRKALTRDEKAKAQTEPTLSAEQAKMLAAMGAPPGARCANCAYNQAEARSGQTKCANSGAPLFGFKVAPGDRCRFFAADPNRPAPPSATFRG